MKTASVIFLILSTVILFGQNTPSNSRPCETSPDSAFSLTPCIPISDSTYLDTAIVIVDQDCWHINYRSLKNGTYKAYKQDTTGKLVLFQIVTYKLNRATDRMLTYHENGQLAHYTTYKKGIPDGLSMSYNKEGVLLSAYFIHLFKEHEISGTFTSYWETGALASVRLIHNHIIISEAFFDKHGKEIDKKSFYEKWGDCTY